jgi:hypothetical protein
MVVSWIMVNHMNEYYTIADQRHVDRLDHAYNKKEILYRCIQYIKQKLVYQTKKTVRNRN